MTRPSLMAALCLVLALAASQASSVTIARSASEPRPHVRTNDELRTELDARYDALQPQHFWIRALRNEWDRRLDLCLDAGCRTRLIEEQNDRLRAVAQTAAVADADSRLRPRGLVPIAAGDVLGAVQTFPSRAGRILVTIDTIVRGGRWFCNLIGEGQFQSDGLLVIETLDEFATRYRLREHPDGSIEIDSTPEFDNHVCGTAGSLQGRYQVRNSDVTPGS